MKKDKMTKLIQIRLTEKQFNKLKLRAKLYAGGRVSKLLRHWIDKAPVGKVDK